MAGVGVVVFVLWSSIKPVATSVSLLSFVCVAVVVVCVTCESVEGSMLVYLQYFHANNQ